MFPGISDVYCKMFIWSISWLWRKTTIVLITVDGSPSDLHLKTLMTEITQPLWVVYSSDNDFF